MTTIRLPKGSSARLGAGTFNAQPYIQVIKMLREKTGSGLHEAKAGVDRDLVEVVTIHFDDEAKRRLCLLLEEYLPGVMDLNFPKRDFSVTDLHEVKDRTALIARMFDQEVVDHAVVVTNPDLEQKARAILAAIKDFHSSL